MNSNNMTASYIGKEKRMQRLLHEGKCVFVPLDDSLISGPTQGLLNLKDKIVDICEAQPSGILGFSGALRIVNEVSPDTPYILNLTASSTRSEHTNKEVVSSVKHALTMGADAVAVHINVSSKYEGKMIRSLGTVSEQCDEYGVPLMVLAYPRKEICNNDVWLSDENYYNLKHSESEQYTNLVAHCTRLAYEMGANIIKTQYTGSKKTFERVINAAQDIPVVIAGGDMLEDTELLLMCKDAVDSGAAGICFGRNVFNRCNSKSIIMALKKIVFNGESVNNAIEYMKQLERGLLNEH